MLKSIKRMFDLPKVTEVYYKELKDAMSEFDETSSELSQYRLYRKEFMEYWDNRLEKLTKIMKGEGLSSVVDGQTKFVDFLKVLVKDKDLLSFVDSYIVEKQSELEQSLKNLEAWKTLWNTLKEKNADVITL